MRKGKILSGISIAALATGLCLAPLSAQATPAAPIATITGDQTQLDSPWGVTASTDGTIYVADNDENAVWIFAPGSNGNVAPIATLAGFNTTLNNIYDVELDTDGNIYVSGSAGILEFAAGATGDVAPIRSITGFAGYGLAVGNDGRIYVTLNSGSSYASSGDVAVFAADASGAATPEKVFPGDGDTVDVAVDDKNNIYISNYANTSIDIWYADTASGSVADRSIDGPATTLGEPYGIDVVCSTGPIFVGNSAAYNIVTFPATGDGNIAPTEVATPGYTYGLGIGQAGNIYATNSETPAVFVYAYERTSCPIDPAPLPDTGANTTPMTIAILAIVGGAIALAIRRRTSA